MRAAALTLLVLALATSACSATKTDPDEARRDRVQGRLEQSFSAPQARCIIAAVDQATLVALDRTTNLPADGAAMNRYTGAVVSCVTDPEGSTSSSSAPATTTTAGG